MDSLPFFPDRLSFSKPFLLLFVQTTVETMKLLEIHFINETQYNHDGNSPESGACLEWCLQWLEVSK